MDTARSDGTAVFVSCDRDLSDIAVVRIDRPKANALSLQVLAELKSTFIALAEDLPRAVVLWGGPKIFCAGGDISGMGGAEEAAALVDAYRAAFDAVATLPRMVVAAMCGYALGGGLELALAADFRVAGERAVFGLPEIQLGLIPGAGGTQRLTRLTGTARAKEMIVTGRRVYADEALQLGFVNQVVPEPRVFDEARTLAQRLAEGPLVAQAAAKRLIDGCFDRPLDAGIDDEGITAAALHHTADARIGVSSFFENGPGRAVFTGA